MISARAVVYGRSTPAASRITCATSTGWERCATWLAGRLLVLAFIRFAIACCSAGGIMRSCSLTMYHDGLVLQAAALMRSPNALAWIAPWLAAITLVIDAGKS